MISLSVIVPVYNGEAWLEACVQSVLPQLDDADQLIFVDDGSTDHSAEALARWASDPHVTVLRQENRGLSAARNAGVPRATGDYLTFLDCDDALAEDAVGRLKAYAEENRRPEFILFDAEVITDDASLPTPRQQALYRTREPLTGILRGEELYLRLNESASYRRTACMCWVRRDYLLRESLFFREGIYYEDTLFLAESMLKAPRGGVLARPLYQRRIHGGSITTVRPSFLHARSAWICHLALRLLASERPWKPETVVWLDRQADTLEGQAREIYGALSQEEINAGENTWPDGQLLRTGIFPRLALSSPAQVSAPSPMVRVDDSAVCREPFRPEHPLVSIIVPVHNNEDVLPETLRDLRAQRLRNLEVLLVDDGSSDSSLVLLNTAAGDDSRFRVLHQENRGAGAARNAGMDEARGEYLIFLDGDDRFDPGLAGLAAARARETHAQVVLFNADAFMSDTGETRSAPFLRPCDGMPEGVFPALSQKDRLFVSLNPWNKLYERAYVQSLGIRYQEQFSCNDLYFTLLALTSAERIACLPNTLTHYRLGGGGNLSSRRGKAPLDVFTAFSAVREGLEARGLWENYRIPFAAKAAESMVRSLDTIASLEGVRTLYDRLWQGGWESLGIDCLTPEEMRMPHGAEILNRVRRMRELPFEEYVLQSLREGPGLSGGVSGFQEIQELRNSYAYRIGTKITWLPHQLKVTADRLKRTLPRGKASRMKEQTNAAANH